MAGDRQERPWSSILRESSDLTFLSYGPDGYDIS